MMLLAPGEQLVGARLEELMGGQFDADDVAIASRGRDVGQVDRRKGLQQAVVRRDRSANLPLQRGRQRLHPLFGVLLFVAQASQLRVRRGELLAAEGPTGLRASLTRCFD